jgi:putative FmdB family regulatory protein
MPTYEYRCRACGHEFELFQQMTGPVKRKCPSCGKPKLQRLIGTGAGVIFKGGGFYETDYRSDSYKKALEAETKAQKPPDEKKPPGAAETTTKSDTQTTAGPPAKDQDQSPPRDVKPKRADRKTSKRRR